MLQLNSWLSAGDNSVSPGDIYQRSETFLVFITDGKGQRPEVVLNILLGTGQSPTTKSYLVPNVRGDETDKP